MGRQAGRLDQILELLFAPAAARLRRGAQRIDQLGGFFAHLTLAKLHLLHGFAQFGIAADAVLFDPLQSFLIAFERRFDGREQGFQLRLALLVRLRKTLVGAVKEGFLRLAQQLAANLAELGRKLLLGILERGDLRLEGFGARLGIGLERGEFAQRRLALGLRRLETLLRAGLDRVDPLC